VVSSWIDLDWAGLGACSDSTVAEMVAGSAASQASYSTWAVIAQAPEAASARKGAMSSASCAGQARTRGSS
jgi:hypothetical protein